MRRNSVLLVEDDPADVKLIRRAFAKAELEAAVYRLSDGEEAISYLDGAAANLRQRYYRARLQ